MSHLYLKATGLASSGVMATFYARGYSARRMDTLGHRLRKALIASGLSQSELARRIGVRSQTINQWLSGAKSPSRDNLLKFVEHTKANIGWLLYGQRLQEQNGDDTVPLQNMRGRFVALVSVEALLSKQTFDHVEEKVFAHFPCGPRSQAFVLPDDSNHPSYPAGAIWIVDPDEVPVPGDMVIGAIGNNLTPVFGVYRVESTASGRVTIIAPSNPNWPAARSDLDRLEVIAVMTEDIKPRRAR